MLVPPVADLPSTVTYLEGPSGSQVSLSRFRSFVLPISDEDLLWYFPGSLS